MTAPARNLSAAEALAEFNQWLTAERRSADKTVEAYTRDIAHFLRRLQRMISGHRQDRHGWRLKVISVREGSSNGHTRLHYHYSWRCRGLVR